MYTGNGFHVTPSQSTHIKKKKSKEEKYLKLKVQHLERMLLI
jgi:hypothetical protein